MIFTLVTLTQGIRISDDDEHFLAPIQEMQSALKKVNFIVKVIMVLGVALICSSIVFWIKARVSCQSLGDVFASLACRLIVTVSPCFFLPSPLQRLKEKLLFADVKCSVNGEVKEAEEELKAFISASKDETNIENKYCSSDVNSSEKESLETSEKATLAASDEDKVVHPNDHVNDLNTHTSNNNN